MDSKRIAEFLDAYRAGNIPVFEIAAEMLSAVAKRNPEVVLERIKEIVPLISSKYPETRLHSLSAVLALVEAGKGLNEMIPLLTAHFSEEKRTSDDLHNARTIFRRMHESHKEALAEFVPELLEMAKKRYTYTIACHALADVLSERPEKFVTEGVAKVLIDLAMAPDGRYHYLDFKEIILHPIVENAADARFKPVNAQVSLILLKTGKEFVENGDARATRALDVLATMAEHGIKLGDAAGILAMEAIASNEMHTQKYGKALGAQLKE